MARTEPDSRNSSEQDGDGPYLQGFTDQADNRAEG